jgi:hypothetical protein
MTAMTAMFNDVEDLARFCAGLAKENVSFEVRPGQAAGYYEVLIYGPETR